MGAGWLLPIYGLIVGTLVGLTGMGGGVLMTPLLVLGLGMPATAAIGTDLAYSSVTKLAGTWQHWRQGPVDIRVVRALALGSVPATLAAMATLFFLHSVDATAVNAVLERFIGVMLVVAAALMMQKAWRGRRGVVEAPPQHLVTLPTGKLIAIGAFGGFLVGLTSIGSGSLIIALLVITISLTPEKLVGTDGEVGGHRRGSCVPPRGRGRAGASVRAQRRRRGPGRKADDRIDSRRIDWKQAHGLGAAPPASSRAGRAAADHSSLAPAVAPLALMLGFTVGLNV